MHRNKLISLFIFIAVVLILQLLTRDIPVDESHDEGLLPHAIVERVSYINKIRKEYLGRHERVGVMLFTGAKTLDLEQKLLDFIEYHTWLGITDFLVAYDSDDKHVLEALRQIQHVRTTIVHEASRSRTIMEAFKRWWDMFEEGSHFHRLFQMPGCHRQMGKQAFAMFLLLGQAKRMKLDWVIQIDDDELLALKNTDLIPKPGILQNILKTIPADVSGLEIGNLEALPETIDVTHRFREITLFKVRNVGFNPDMSQIILLKNKGYKYNLYVNGKQMVRPGINGLIARGPHGFQTYATQTDTAPARLKFDNRATSPTNLLVILHYAYSNPSDISSKAERCPLDEKYDMLRGLRRHEINLQRQKQQAVMRVLRKCWPIEFDAEANMAALLGAASTTDFFKRRIMLGNAGLITAELNAQRLARYVGPRTVLVPETSKASAQ